MEAAALCGAKVVRSAVEWNVLQKSPDTIRWELMDWLVDSYGASGIELQVILGFTPRWAAPASLRGSRDWRIWNRAAPDPGAWRSYVRAMAGRYRGRIRFWEVWNEPDLSVFSRMTLAEYIALQKSAFAEIRASAPEAKVMTGGFAMAAEGNHPGQNSPTFQADFLKAAKGSFDIHAVHQHGAFARYAQAIDEAFLPMRRRTGVSGVPWYANETAVSSVGGMERMQAETLFKKLIFTWSRGAVGYTWYDLRNDGTSERNAEHHYGMLTHDFQVKPVYPVFNLLAGHFRNAHYLRQWKSDDDLWTFEFQAEKPGVFLIPAWNESPFAASVSLAFSTDAEDVRKFDLMGNSTSVRLSGGRGIFEVGAEPAFLRLEGAGFVKPEPACVSLKGIPVALPDKPLSVRVLLRNSNVSGRTCTLNFAGKKQRIALGSEKTREVRCEFPADVVSPSLAWETSDGLCGVIRIPLLRGRKILPEPFADRAPDFLLRDRKFVFSLTSGNPAFAHRIWSGPEDLSAKGWIGVSNGMLRLRFEVVDDIHSQKHRGISLWQGDSVQAALQFPAQNGYWEFGFSLPESGAPETMLFQTPRGFDGAAVSAGIRLQADRSGTATRYDVEIPLGKLGVVPGSGSVFRFNFLVNDNDGEGRDGWIALAPGIGEGTKSPEQFPLLVIP